LCELEKATVRDVYQALLQRRRIAYTTVMTMMKILEEKGYLKKRLQERAYVYRASRPKNQVIKAMVHEFVDRVFNGSAEPLLMHLVEDRCLPAKDLEKNPGFCGPSVMDTRDPANNLQRARIVSSVMETIMTAKAHTVGSTYTDRKNSRFTASATIQAQATSSRPASTRAAGDSTLPCPKGCSRSAGLSETRTEKYVTPAATRSSECAASERMPRLRVGRPTTT
jgi:predicted transcriptional regulator